MEAVNIITEDVISSGIKVGDKLAILLKGYPFPYYLLTAHKVVLGKYPKVLFIFDDCIDVGPMNENNTTLGGYEQSDLRWFIEGEFYDSLPKWIKADIFGLSIPTFDEIFGIGEDSLILMSSNKYRVSANKSSYWLNGTTLYGFELVDEYGRYGTDFAKADHGIRPEFWMPIREESYAEN